MEGAGLPHPGRHQPAAALPTHPEPTRQGSAQTVIHCGVSPVPSHGNAGLGSSGDQASPGAQQSCSRDERLPCSRHPGHDKGFGGSVPGTRAETNLYKFCYLTVTSFPLPRSLSRWSRGLGAVPSAPARRSPRRVSWAGPQLFPVCS